MPLSAERKIAFFYGAGVFTGLTTLAYALAYTLGANALKESDPDARMQATGISGAFLMSVAGGMVRTTRFTPAAIFLEKFAVSATALCFFAELLLNAANQQNTALILTITGATFLTLWGVTTVQRSRARKNPPAHPRLAASIHGSGTALGTLSSAYALTYTFGPETLREKDPERKAQLISISAVFLLSALGRFTQIWDDTKASCLEKFAVTAMLLSLSVGFIGNAIGRADIAISATLLGATFLGVLNAAFLFRTTSVSSGEKSSAVVAPVSLANAEALKACPV